MTEIWLYLQSSLPQVPRIRRQISFKVGYYSVSKKKTFSREYHMGDICSETWKNFSCWHFWTDTSNYVLDHRILNPEMALGMKYPILQTSAETFRNRVLSNIELLSRASDPILGLLIPGYSPGLAYYPKEKCSSWIFWPLYFPFPNNNNNNTLIHRWTSNGQTLEKYRITVRMNAFAGVWIWIGSYHWFLGK